MMTDNEIISVDVEKCLYALSEILGVDYSYYKDDKSVSMILDAICIAKKLESIVKEKNEQIEILKINCLISHEKAQYWYDKTIEILKEIKEIEDKNKCI